MTSNNVNRLAAQVTDGQRPQGAPYCWTEPATVTSVVNGAAADSNALVTVNWRGALQQAAYLASYTPAVGHTVIVVYQDGELTILGRTIGTPPS
jgi:hypothetical protein